MKISLLLTGTIDPGATPFVTLVDPDARRMDYKQALDSWRTVRGIDHIVFCENSHQDLADFRTHAHTGDFEAISFDGNQSAQRGGKGAGEFAIIDHALRNSSELATSDLVLKSTGRLTVHNAEKLIQLVRDQARADVDVLCDLRTHLSVAESRVFFARPEFLRDRLLPLAPIVDDHAGVYFEHALARATHLSLADGRRWRPLPCAPRIAGRSGSTGDRYPDSLPMRAAFGVRAWLERRLHRGFGVEETLP